MKRVKTITVLVLMISCSAILFGIRTSKYVPLWIEDKIKTDKRTFFRISDAVDDDKGPGNYVYPTNKIYTNGSFDITEFKVEDKGSKIWMRIKFRASIQKEKVDYSGYNGWILQMIDIYIDTDQKEGSGFTEALPGRRIKFAPKSAWDKMVLITPENPQNTLNDIRDKAENILFSKMSEKIIIPDFYKVRNREIIAILDKKKIGIPDEYWGFQVCILGFYSGDSKDSRTSFDKVINQRHIDGVFGNTPMKFLNIDRFKNLEVVGYPENHSFGYGTNYEGNPNVIDIITPVNVSQYDALKNYESYPNASLNRYATISCVYRKIKPLKKSLKISFKNYSQILSELDKKKKTINQISELAEKIKKFESEKRKMIDQGILPPEDKTIKNKVILTDKDKCQLNEKIIHEAARKYMKNHPEDENITILDLLYEGYLKKDPTCPSGGRYAIYGESSGALKVRCFNPTGIEHGVYDGNKYIDGVK
ncbi:hypothetical protein KAJ27_13905 [bacterium]|nr:hypothetical protein [bacterium]